MTHKTAALYTERRPGVVLPTLEGCTHGIVGKGPWEVQCDGCLVVRSGDAPRHGGLQIILADIKFNPRAKDDHRRLCPDCRATEWKDYRS